MNYVADFETTKEQENTKTRVWGYGVCEVGNSDNFFWGTRIDDFMKRCRTKGNKNIYFHNLKFDGEFIIAWLLKNGYEYDEDKNSNTFNTTISKEGQFYRIEVIYKRYNKRYWKTTFYDSMKKLPFSVKDLAEAFKLPMMKGDIDHEKPRTLGYKPTHEEVEYIRNDVVIVAEALHIQFEQELKRMTVGSDAFNSYKKLIGKRTFERHFPVLPVALDTDIRKSYKGGFTYLNPVFKEEDIGKGVVFDVNSLYPYVMYDKLLPYGEPLSFEGEYEPDPLYPLYIIHIRCVFQLKENKIPTIQIKSGKYVQTEYLTSSNGEEEELWLTSVDFELMKDHYHLEDLEIFGGHKFRASSELFKEYIEYWSEVKMNNTGAIRQLAKLMLNSLYGKFASNPDLTGRYPYLDDDGVVKYAEGEENIGDPIYTALASFVTSYAREITIRSAQEEVHRFIYADTDSLHLIGEEMPKGLSIDPKKLGYWDHEGTFEKARFVRQKSYVEQLYMKYDNGKKVQAGIEDHEFTELKVTCAGMPDNVKEKVTFENFRSGLQIDGKLLPSRVVGGIILEPTTYTLKG